MKLLYCHHCGDVVSLRFVARRCSCGRSGGYYKLDGLNAVILGDAIPLGFDNHSFQLALKNRPKSGLGTGFKAFVIPFACETIQVEDKP